MSDLQVKNGIEERSPATNELLIRPPDFFDKWSLLIFFFFLLTFIACACMIEYPDNIEADAVVTNDGFPAQNVHKPGTAYFAKIEISQIDIGAIALGMKVQLRIDAYPYKTHGFVPGKLIYISNEGNDGVFKGIVEFDHGLITTQSKEIPYSNGLLAKAIISTKDTKLIVRLCQKILGQTKINGSLKR